MRYVQIGALAAVFGVFCPTGARALDLTGTWAAKMKCVARYDSVDPQKLKGLATLAISQSGASFYMNIVGLDTFPLYSSSTGTVITSVKDPKQGHLASSECTTSFGVAVHAYKVKVNPTEGSGKLKGYLTGVAPGILIECKISAKRSSTTDPGITSCSAP